ncbi:ribonuclease HIII [Falsibacillus pallidus]|uniref:Ribonuclease HIII n=1 Tax=Falsibacillus pallidus TaxID=493781 RepID=A0A370GLS9_9BACI|nr:ribonuclease HIII [Falsibacillus pallidus]RDI44216.1 ribonuclease HIII [Falsibacillus pallidus]
MANAVISATAETILKMKDHYKKDLVEKVPQGGVFSAKINGCTITAYKSGKVLFQGANGEAESSKWGTAAPAKPKSPKTKTSGMALPENISDLSLIGSDEVGTGDYFGPITVVSAYVERSQIPLLKELGVKDSKNLSDPQIIEIAKKLLKFIPYSLLTLPNKKYNQWQKKGMTQGKIKAVLHNHAIQNLLEKIEPTVPEAILIDQFTEANTYYKHIQGQKRIIRDRVYFSTKGESIHIAVAAASILARYAFLKAMDSLSEKAGFIIPKGAGPIVDKAAAKLIQSKGEAALEDFTKLHFANTQKAMKIVYKK